MGGVPARCLATSEAPIAAAAKPLSGAGNGASSASQGQLGPYVSTTMHAAHRLPGPQIQCRCRCSLGTTILLKYIHNIEARPTWCSSSLRVVVRFTVKSWMSPALRHQKLDLIHPLGLLLWARSGGAARVQGQRGRGHQARHASKGVHALLEARAVGQRWKHPSGTPRAEAFFF